MADEAAAPRSRRALLTAAAGAAGALAASAALPFAASAADPNDVVKGTDNPTTATTSISNSGASGFGVQGGSTTEAGAVGWSVTAPDPLLYPTGTTAYTGVFGYSPSDPINFFGVGAWGESDDYGVLGTGGFAGVYGYGGVGVVGESASTAAGVLALAASATDLALEVQGKVKFSRSGRTTIASGKSSIKITLAGVSSGCRIFAVLHSNRTGRWVQSVVPVTGSFTIYLNGTVSSATYVAWFVLN
jgi:hypothetical protein